MLAFNTDLTAEQRIQKAGMALNAHRKWVAFIGISMIGTTEVVEEGVLPMETAATNGRDVWYSRVFVDRIPDSAVRFTKLHEEHHVALEHLSTYEHLVKLDPMTANIAMDEAINNMIMEIDGGEGFVTLPLDEDGKVMVRCCLLYTSPSQRDS